jgi:rubrerythrin
MRGRLFEAIRDTTSTETFACGFCGLSYERERPNCPACGGPVEAA